MASKVRKPQKTFAKSAISVTQRLATSCEPLIELYQYFIHLKKEKKAQNR